MDKDRAWALIVVALVAGFFLGVTVAFAISDDFEQRRCVALEERLGNVNLAWSSKGCVLAEDL